MRNKSNSTATGAELSIAFIIQSIFLCIGDKQPPGETTENYSIVWFRGKGLGLSQEHPRL